MRVHKRKTCILANSHNLLEKEKKGVRMDPLLGRCQRLGANITPNLLQSPPAWDKSVGHEVDLEAPQFLRSKNGLQSTVSGTKTHYK